MASADADVDVSHVSALTCSARKQIHGKHLARSVELFERAVAAAEALRQPDCLIVARLRQMYLNALSDMIAASLTGERGASSDLAAAAARRLSSLQARLPAVLETLERRRAQGTLRAGRCRAHEVAWEADYLQAEGLLGFDDESLGASSDEESVSAHSQYVGVEAYFAAAHTAVSTLNLLEYMRLQHDPLTAICLTFIEHALQFASQPDESLLHSDQTQGTLLTSMESFFLHSFLTTLLPSLKPEAPGCAGVLAAWHDLARNGPLLHYLLGEEMRADVDRHDISYASVQAAKDARKPLRTCALPACGAREAHVAHFKKCSACSSVVYCSKAHQTEHWPDHKAACKAARKASATAHES